MSDDRRPRGRPAPAAENPVEWPTPEVWFRELRKAMGWNPLAWIDLGPVVDSCARMTDSWVASQRIALGAALEVAECQFRMLREVVDEGLATQASLLRGEAGPPQDQAWRAVHGFERLRENLLELSAIVEKSQGELAEEATRRMAEMTEEVESHLARLRQ